ncbi:reverse transcriptase [Elysia marginata]|uniref:Reverse transcriptase n=1 Tax=Elysia marginata TaxID=1093978 RepID=A0AAV4JAZ6_9GAST|nr:reverse transcriptase [Elysia marginata]
MAIMQEIFSDTDLSAETAYEYHYVLDLHNKIKESCKLAQQSAQESSAQSKIRLTLMAVIVYYMSTCCESPSQDEKLDSVSHTALEFSRVVDFDDSAKCYAATVAGESSGALGECIPTPCTNQEKNEVQINSMLDWNKVNDIKQLLDEFSDVLSAVPGQTTTIEHHIALNSDVPIRVKPYPLPFASQNFVREEVTKLLDMGVIEPSTSSYCSNSISEKERPNTAPLHRFSEAKFHN